MSIPDVENKLVPLIPAVQNYAWGITPAGADSIVARMHAYSATAVVDATRPYAELWVGTHPNGPAVLRRDASVSLADFLQQHRPADAKGPDLPYLLKILSVAKPLSIQAHPDKELAKKLHADNPSAYKDNNHKPEMCVALTDFEGMCNFRPTDQIVAHLESLPALAGLCGGEGLVSALRDAGSADEKRAALRLLFSSLMSAADDAVAAALDGILAEKKLATERSEADELFLRLVGYYPGDVGCFASYLLNLIRIKPGQAFFMAANEPHAYLKGQCVEIMACSDNVVRAGLTPKFKDVSTLVDMLTYNDGPPKIMDGDVVDQYTTLYRPPVEEFQLSKIVVPAGRSYEVGPTKGPVMIMVMGGTGWFGLKERYDEKDLDTRFPLSTGSVYYVADSNAFIVQADKSIVDPNSSPDLYFFKASIHQD